MLIILYKCGLHLKRSQQYCCLAMFSFKLHLNIALYWPLIAYCCAMIVSFQQTLCCLIIHYKFQYTVLETYFLICISLPLHKFVKFGQSSSQRYPASTPSTDFHDLFVKTFTGMWYSSTVNLDLEIRLLSLAMARKLSFWEGNNKLVNQVFYLIWVPLG